MSDAVGLNPVWKYMGLQTPDDPGTPPGLSKILAAQIVPSAPGQLIPSGVPTQVLLGTVTYDMAGYGAIPNQLTIPPGKGGLYQVGFVVGLDTGGLGIGGMVYNALVMLNGGFPVVQVSRIVGSASSNIESHSVVATGPAADGDNLQLWVGQLAAVPQPIPVSAGQFTGLYIMRLGDFP